MPQNKEKGRESTTVHSAVILHRGLSTRLRRQAKALGRQQAHYMGDLLESMADRVLLAPGTLQFVERMAKEWGKTRDEAATALVQIGRAQIERR